MKNVPQSKEEYLKLMNQWLYSLSSKKESFVLFSPDPQRFYNPFNIGIILTDFEIEAQQGGLYLNVPDDKGEMGIGKGRSLSYRGCLKVGGKTFLQYSNFVSCFITVEILSSTIYDEERDVWLKIDDSSIFLGERIKGHRKVYEQPDFLPEL